MDDLSRYAVLQSLDNVAAVTLHYAGVAVVLQVL